MIGKLIVMPDQMSPKDALDGRSVAQSEPSELPDHEVDQGQEELDEVRTETSLTAGPELIAQPRLRHAVLVSDRIPVRQRRLEDLLEALASLAGIVLVLLVGVYASATAQGVEDDVREAFGSVIRQILFLPLSVLEGLYVIAAPVALIAHLLRRGQFAGIIHTVLTGVASAMLGWALLLAIPHLPPFISDSLTIYTDTGELTSINVVIIVLAAMLTVTGTSSTSQTIRYSWWGIWLLLFFSLIRGAASLSGVLLTILLGRLLGNIARWIVGFNDGRAMPTDLVAACLDISLIPERIVRCDVTTKAEPLETWRVSEGSDSPDFRRGQISPPLVTSSASAPETSFEVFPQFSFGSGRVYQVWLADGAVLDMHVLDPDTGLQAIAEDAWHNFRFKGFSRWIAPAVKPSAERAMLTAASASAAGVRTSKPVGLADAGSSVAVFWETLPPVASLFDARESGVEITDDILDQAWSQLHSAHERGVCHRNLDRDALRIDESMNLWVLDWSQGDVGVTAMGRLIDCAQMLVHLSLVSDPDRAVAAARRQIGTAELLSTGLALQSAVLPRGLRTLARKTKILDALRQNLSEVAPTSQAPAPLKVERFSPRTVLMFILAATALVVVFGSLNFNAVVQAVASANLWWILGAFLLGSLTWVGAAIPLVAFSPKRIGLWNTTMAQMAASIVALVAPAGIGPAAVNLRFLNKNKVATPVAVATVTLVQVSQFLTSVVLLIVVVALTGTSIDFDLPTTAIVWGFAAVATVVTATLSIPRLRRWLIKKIQPSWNQAYPQLLWILGHPKELSIAFAGNLLMNLGYISAFGAALAAFGVTLSPVTLAITYLVSTTLGSVIPTPGGIGPVEAALTAGLQVAGVPAAVALSTAVVFRLVTFYGRIPIGWIALKRMEKKGLL